MGMFKYLGAIIPVMVAEVFLAVYLVWKFASTGDCCRLPRKNESTSNDMPEEQTSGHNMAFQNTFRCCLYPDSRLASILLALYRFCCFSYFFGVGVLWNLLRDDGWQYFTNWNLMLISTFYACALSASFIGLCFGHSDAEWPQRIRRLGYAVHILFEVVGATAILVTTVDFSLLNPQFAFWNASEHFATLLSLVIELCVNSLPVRLDHYGYNALWASVYLCFIWPVVATGARHHWPYDFLDVSGPDCFIWYTGLLIADIIFYCIWMGLYRLKLYVFHRFFGIRVGRRSETDLLNPKDETFTDNALFTEMKGSLGSNAC